MCSNMYLSAADGKYHCVRCKKSFRRERHYNTHKCLADSNYVDITKKDLILQDGAGDSDEEEEEGNPHRDSDPTPDYKYRIPGTENKGRRAK